MADDNLGKAQEEAGCVLGGLILLSVIWSIVCWPFRAIKKLFS